MILNYFVGEAVISLKGSGIASAISDHMRMMKNIMPFRLFVLNECARPLYGEFDCEVIFTNGEDLDKYDGVWYTHTHKASLVLSKLGIEHYSQFHNGDLLLNDTLTKLRKELRMRPQEDVEREARIMALPHVKTICQTEGIAKLLKEKYNIDAISLPMPCYREKIDVSDKYYDLTITGSVSRMKGLWMALRPLQGVTGLKIAIVCAITANNQKANKLTEELRDFIMDLTWVKEPEKLEVDWYFGASRDEVNQILALSKRVAHPSLVECYPYIILEASQYTTVMVNKHAVYPSYSCVDTKVIDFSNLDDMFGEELPPAINLDEHNKLGEKAWKCLMTSIMKS